jgi:hypothetical protein
VDKLANRWPSTLGASPYVTRFATSPTNGTSISLITGSAPIDGAYIAIWSSVYKKIAKTRVLSSVLTAPNTYTVALYTPIDVTWFQPAAGAITDFVMPDAVNIEAYCATVAQAFAVLGPGEITADANKLPRSKRRPYVEETDPCNFGSAHLGQLTIAHPEITNVVLYAGFASVDGSALASISPIACPVPSAGSPPNVLRLGHLALYPA